MSEIFIGVDLGGTNAKIGCFDSELELITKISIPTDVKAGPKRIVDRIGAAVEGSLAESGFSMKDICAAGIGSPGVIDIDAGVVKRTSNLEFKNVPLQQMLSECLGKPVVLENDANVTCWAEHVAGAGRGADDIVLLTLGTGIGSGIISAGELVHGFGNSAGESGHIIIYPDGRLCGCGQRGCAEMYASAAATATRATEAIRAGNPSSLEKLFDEKGQITCKDVYGHTAAGDKLAKKITDGTAKALALLCVSLFHVSGPRRIIFYGGMIGAGKLLLEPVHTFFNEFIWTMKKEDVQLCFAQLGSDAGIIGAAALAIHARTGLKL